MLESFFELSNYEGAEYSEPLFENFDRIAAEGISVLYISSELDELVRGCDRIVILSEGRKVKELVGEEISSDNIMAAIASHSTQS